MKMSADPQSGMVCRVTVFVKAVTLLFAILLGVRKYKKCWAAEVLLFWLW